MDDKFEILHINFASTFWHSVALVFFTGLNANCWNFEYITYKSSSIHLHSVPIHHDELSLLYLVILKSDSSLFQYSLIHTDKRPRQGRIRRCSLHWKSSTFTSLCRLLCLRRIRKRYFQSYILCDWLHGSQMMSECVFLRGDERKRRIWIMNFAGA